MASPIQAGISSPRGFQGGFGPIRENSIAVDGLCWPETARPRVRHRPLDVVPTPLAEWRESDRCLSAAGAIIALPLRTPALGAFLAVPRPSGLLPRLHLLTPHHVLRVIDGSFHDGLIALGRLLFELPRRPRVRLAQRGPLPRLPRPIRPRNRRRTRGRSLGGVPRSSKTVPGALASRETLVGFPTTWWARSLRSRPRGETLGRPPSWR